MNDLPVKSVAVLGAGTMGTQIGWRCAQHGYSVRLVDSCPQALPRAAGSLRQRSESSPPTVEDGPASFARIVFTSTLEDALPEVDLVIESVPENLDLKRRVFGQMDRLCPPATILASNSSSLRMSKIELEVQHRERVCNLHFYQLPTRLVEIMRGSGTSEATTRRVQRFCRSIGTIPIVLRRESTGFLYNRIWRAIKRESLRIVAEGVATPEEVDRAWMLAWNAPRGPFGWMDLIGLDVVRDIENVYFEESKDATDKPPHYLDEMLARGELGQKAGRGFYAYPNPAFENPSWLAGEPGNHIP